VAAYTAERLQLGLGTAFVGRQAIFLDETASTNDVARDLARAGAPEGTLVVADYQAAGRGRQGRRWHAPPGSSLLLSVIFRPPLAPDQVQQLTMVCGLAVVDAIAAATGLQAGLKWPNDVLIGAGKLGGILSEAEIRGQRVEYVLVGIGLNVNLDPHQLPEGLSVPATSLSSELGQTVERLGLLRALLQRLEERYVALCQGKSPRQEWAQRLTMLGQPVVVQEGQARLEGVAEGVAADGALLLRLPDGRLQTILAGDVSLRTNLSDLGLVT
jgi:BirA family transcriptional regulator, biotin operon repressor / biotin---[acetyl-CoA-carboxylase] ligase